jgi:hypothetical protein
MVAPVGVSGARIKRGVRAAIALCGGVDGAAATVERCRSVAGDWNNLAHKAFPSIDLALALDEVAVARGELPPITAALARELGGIFVPHIDAAADADTLPGMVLQLMHELGDVSASMRTGMADGDLDDAEIDRVLREQDDLDRASARLRGALMQLRGGKKISGASIVDLPMGARVRP